MDSGLGFLVQAPTTRLAATTNISRERVAFIHLPRDESIGMRRESCELATLTVVRLRTNSEIQSESVEAPVVSSES